ncbi:hypothetical protein [Phytohabitans houttuyneae]|uniref:Uncharacterized protein n=1 Tax=Phytohabitans houttuyneae TaxID=1076126 RepID=A0A6V8KK51_9ACTN|nr:hypothetical protein [Phytohabitans houttuyneae]GFJ85513.1 hypothetical protein Phou_096930 [Phytohabitans houttuyneae]
MVVHTERVAWDGASAIVAALDSAALYPWLHGEVSGLLGVAAGDALRDSFRMLHGPQADRPFVETAKWRARLDEVVRAEPQVAGRISVLVTQVNARIAPIGLR